MPAYCPARRAIALLALLIVTLSAPSAWSQAPGSFKIVVPYPPASGPDILSRLMAEQIGRAQGPTVVVENRPGGATLIGTEAVARAAPDGNTVLLVANTFVVNPSLKKLSYDPVTSFEPVCYLAATPIVLMVNSASPYRSVADLVAAARAKPGELSLAAAPASSLQIAFEVLKHAANIDMTFVPYAGTAPAINALAGGHVTAVMADYPTVVSQLQSGNMRGLLTASPARVELLPDVPTFAESGLGKYEANIFYGVVAPAKTPADAISHLTGWFTGALKAPDMKPKLAKQGLLPIGTCGAEFGTYLRTQFEEYARVIREANIKAE
jgi:tripartite-type tricarboxylate transporter receptor subunit TctC